MKKLLTAALAACLFLLLLEGQVFSQQSGLDGPPVAQALVREGDFAVDLVEALQMGAARDEAQAESTLAAIGIILRHGTTITCIRGFPIRSGGVGYSSAATSC